MLYRDHSGKFASRRGGRRRFRRNPEEDPLQAIARAEARRIAAKKAAETRARNKAEAAVKATKEAEKATKEAQSEHDAALKEIAQAEAKRAAAEARKAVAEAKKAEKEAKDAAEPAPRAPRRRYNKEELAKRARDLRKRSRRVKDPGLKSVYAQRASALSLRARKDKLSKKAQQAMKAHGLTRVNPGLRGISEQLKVLAPRLAVTAVAAAGAYGAGAWYAGKMQESDSPFMRKYGAAVGTGGFTAAAFVVARYMAPRYSAAVLSGGLAATIVQVLLARRAEVPAPAPEMLIEQGAPVAGIPSVEDFANPTAEQILANSGSLRGSIF